MALAHVGEQVEGAARHRHVERLADQPGDGRRVRLAAREDGEHVLDVDHADDGIELAAIDRQAAVPGLGEQLDEGGEARALLDRDDVGARHADVAGVALAEVEEIAHHLPFERRQVALGVGSGVALMAVDRLLQLVAQRVLGLAAEDQRLEALPAATSVVGHRRWSILADQIGVGDAEARERLPLDLLHALRLVVVLMVIA